MMKRYVHRAQRVQHGQEDAQQHRPSGSFHRDGHEPCHARRRTLVSIGRPLMEGHGRNLEQQPGGGCQQREDNDRIVRPRRHVLL